jgi:hypothetical protein
MALERVPLQIVLGSQPAGERYNGWHCFGRATRRSSQRLADWRLSERNAHAFERNFNFHLSGSADMPRKGVWFDLNQLQWAAALICTSKLHLA